MVLVGAFRFPVGTYTAARSFP